MTYTPISSETYEFHYLFLGSVLYALVPFFQFPVSLREVLASLFLLEKSKYYPYELYGSMDIP